MSKADFQKEKGLVSFSDIVQTTSLNERTRNKVYTAIEDTFISLEEIGGYKLKNNFCEYFYEEILPLTKNHIPCSYNGFPYDYNYVFKEIYNIVQSHDYNELLDLIESMIKVFEYVDKSNPYKFDLKKNIFIDKINSIFIKENVNYKIIGKIVTDIISDEEIKSIDETINNNDNLVSSHFQKAFKLLYVTKD